MLEIRSKLVPANSMLEQLDTELTTAWRGESNPLQGRVQLHRAGVLMQLGCYADAAACFQAGLRECLDCGDPAAIWGYLGLAELSAVENHLSRAYAHLAQAERLMQYRRITEPLYQDLLAFAYGKLWLQQGQARRAEEAMHKCLPSDRNGHQRRPLYGSPDLILRMDLLLVQARSANGVDGTVELNRQLQRALAQGRRLLACELWFALADEH